MADTTENIPNKKAHTCCVCGYVTTWTTCMKQHLKANKPCGVPSDPVVFKQFYDRYVNNIKPIKEIKCEKCEKVFKSRNGLCQHRKTCKIVPKATATHDEIRVIIKEELAKVTQTQAKPAVFNQLNIFMNLNAFGSETFDHITSEHLDSFVQRTRSGQRDLAMYIHRHEKNKNILPANTPDRILVFNGEYYEPHASHDVFDKMLKQSYDLMLDHFQEHRVRLRREVFPTQDTYYIVADYSP